MSESEKIESSIQKINELVDLLEGNEHQDYLYSHLITLQVELKRQLTNLQHRFKIKE